MVSDSLTGRVSPVGDGLSLLIAGAVASATVITRRYADIRMTPAVCTGATTGCAVALVLSLAGAGTVAVEIWQAPILVVFGLSLGLGLALFTRSEEHTSELQSLMRISYAVFCLKKKKTHQQ